MDPRSDNDMKGIVEEMAQDRGQVMNRTGTRRSTTRRATGPGTSRTLLFGGIAAAVLLAAVLLLIGGGQTEGEEVLQILAERLDRIETRLDRLEETGKQVPALAGRIDGLGESVSKLEKDRRTLSTSIETLNRRLEAVTERAPAQGSTSPAAAEGASAHKVQRGETLFSIAKQYGLSVEELCRLNGIKKTDVIQPGQTLTVGREG
ncbi:MAG: LysM peptidoglycan-binding domain-containing protein [Thermodesulfobacteriota bacterium]